MYKTKMKSLAKFTQGGEWMFHLPPETFWLLLPWPLIWLSLAFFMYNKLKKEDEAEDKSE
jgi:hypothetical protein